VARDLRQRCAEACGHPGAIDALDRNGLRSFPYARWARPRINQFDKSRGVVGFPERPQDAMAADKRGNLEIWN